MRRIGIDVGGTNTDAVLIDGTRIIASLKTATTEDVTSGVTRALSQLIERAGDAARSAQIVIIGTTHFVNAVVERRHLKRVAVIRLCLPASSSVMPFIDWPDDLRQLVKGSVDLLPGGFEIDGQEISALDEAAVRQTAVRIRDAGLNDVAISCVFSPLRDDHELRAAEIVRSVMPQCRMTLSKDLGRIGLLERENVTILNSALADLAQRTTRAFRSAIRDSGLTARLYLTQNDGTVMSAETASDFRCFALVPGRPTACAAPHSSAA